MYCYEKTDQKLNDRQKLVAEKENRPNETLLSLFFSFMKQEVATVYSLKAVHKRQGNRKACRAQPGSPTSLHAPGNGTFGG
jgi:hypothetical protein